MRFRSFSKKLAQTVETIGVVAILLMFVFTVVDVVGAKLFLKPLRGATDLVGFAQIIAISSTIAIGLFLEKHIKIEFLVPRMPRLFQKISDCLVNIFGIALFIFLAWGSFQFGLSLKRAGEMASTAHLPLYPFAFALAVFAVIASLYFISQLLFLFFEEGGER